MEQLPTEKKEKVQGRDHFSSAFSTFELGESSSSSETESILPILSDKLKAGESPQELGSDTDLEVALPAILENEAEFDGSDLIAIPNDLKDSQLEAMIRAKKYSKITDEQRRDFIDAVEVNGEKIINAAKRFNINYSSAKSILNVYKSEGRSIKKLTRNRGAKETEEGNQDCKVGTEVKIPDNSHNNQNQPKPVMVTFDAGTQTQPPEESQGDNYLLALRDRLIASKTDKRENPYTNSVSHDFTRHSGNISDYTQLQMAGNGYENAFNMQMEGSRSQAPEKQQVQFVSTSPYSGTSGGQGSSPGQYISTGNSQSQSYQQQQQQGSQQISFNPENRGIYSANQQSPGSGYISSQQPQVSLSQQEHKNQAQQYLMAQNNLDQQRLQSAAGSQNQLVNLGFSQPGTNNDFSGMSYTGTGQSQYFSDSANDSRNMMQMGQVQYLQPIMYLMPSNFSGMGGMGGQNGFAPAGLQGLQNLGNLGNLQNLGNLGNLQNLGNLGNLVSLPGMPGNSFMLYNGQAQGGQSGQSQAGQSNQGGQSQSQSQSGQSQNQSNQNQGQNQGQSQAQYQSQNYYQNQGPYFGSRCDNSCEHLLCA